MMLLVFAMVLGVAFAQENDCCSMEDRKEVSQIWQDMWSAEFSGRRVLIAQVLFQDLFVRDPASKGLFTMVNVDDPDSPEFKAHCVRVVNGMDTCINMLADPSTLDEQLAHLARQHVAREGITKTHFRLFAQSFLAVLPQVSPCFNPDAWNRCFVRIAKGIAVDLPE